MKILINGKEVDTTSKNLAELAAELALPSAGVAVAVNNQLITRALWASHPLAEGESVVIIKAACGG